MGRRWFVYTLTNRVNGKVYVGKSWNPSKRWSLHKHYARNGCQFRLHRAIRKYGADAFVLRVVSEFGDEGSCFDAEQALIAELGSRDESIGYNMTDGGEGASGRPMPDSTRQKFRAWSSSERAQSVRAAAQVLAAQSRIGVRPSQENLEKMWAARRLVGLSEAGRAGIRAAHAGRPKSPEQRAKIRASIERPLTDEQVLQIRTLSAEGASRREIASLFGVPHKSISRIVLGKTYRLAGGPTSKKEVGPRRVLTGSQVAEMRERYVRGDVTQAKLAEQYGVSQCVVSRAISGKY